MLKSMLVEEEFTARLHVSKNVWAILIARAPKELPYM
mgnify:CR=1 FL=1